MEIYSPKKFGQVSFSDNRQQPGREEPRRKAVKAEPKKSDEERETVGERMKRVFYERLRAFFEYEEVS
jgi:hypothetical protein